MRVSIAPHLRTPHVHLEWDPIPSERYSHWSDEARFGLDLLRSSERPWAVVAATLGADATRALRADVAAAPVRDTEAVNRFERVWSRTVCHGFCSGDLDRVLTLVVTDAGVALEDYEHSYGVRTYTREHRATLAEFVDPACALRTGLEEIAPRVDAWIRLLLPGGVAVS